MQNRRQFLAFGLLGIFGLGHGRLRQRWQNRRRVFQRKKSKRDKSGKHFQLFKG